jgi:hypothetical protein
MQDDAQLENQEPKQENTGEEARRRGSRAPV